MAITLWLVYTKSRIIIVKKYKIILDNLAEEPRSFDTSDDPGFWTNGNEILCPSEMECDILAEFLEDLLREVSTVVVKTGYYDPLEDVRNGETDDNTGFYYIDFD